jgi:hypothetical protein
MNILSRHSSGKKNVLDNRIVDIEILKSGMKFLRRTFYDVNLQNLFE